MRKTILAVFLLSVCAFATLSPLSGGSSGGGITSINADTTAAQVITNGTGISAISTSGGTTTITNSAPMSGGTSTRVSVWTGASSATGYAGFTSDSSGNATANSLISPLYQTADQTSSNATALVVRGGNVSGGSGNGGDLNLAGGTTAGGTAGNVNLKAAGNTGFQVSGTGDVFFPQITSVSASRIYFGPNTSAPYILNNAATGRMSINANGTGTLELAVNGNGDNIQLTSTKTAFYFPFANNLGTTSPSGGSAGTITCGEPFLPGGGLGEAYCHLIGYTVAGTATYSLPTAFTTTPYKYGDTTVVAVASCTSTTITVTAATTVTGYIFCKGD